MKDSLDTVATFACRLADAAGRETLIDAPGLEVRSKSSAGAYDPVTSADVGAETAMRSLTEAFNSRELLKVKVQSAAPLSAAEAGEQLASRLPGVHHVQTIGRTVVLYRRHPEKPEIELRIL